MYIYLCMNRTIDRNMYEHIFIHILIYIVLITSSSSEVSGSQVDVAVLEVAFCSHGCGCCRVSAPRLG